VNEVSNASYYLLPGYQAMIAMIELKEIQDISSHLLKYFAGESDVEHWESTAIPEIAELYSGSRACIGMLEHLMKQEPPPQYRERVEGGGICVSGDEYMGFVGLMETMRALKKSVEVRHNISFEIH